MPEVTLRSAMRAVSIHARTHDTRNARTHSGERGRGHAAAARELPARDAAAALRGRHGEAAGGAGEGVGRERLDGPCARTEETTSRARVDLALAGETTGRRATGGLYNPSETCTEYAKGSVHIHSETSRIWEGT